MGASPSCPQVDGLPLQWAGLSRFVLLDTDFGDGQRFMGVWQAWQADPDRPPRLHYLAVCAAPLAAAAVPAALRADWPPAVAGWQRIALDSGRVTLDLMPGRLEDCLAQIEARVDALYLIGPLGSATALARLVRPGTALVARAPEPALRQSLCAAGFVVDAESGAPWQRAVFASRRPPPPSAPVRARHAIVIGAGVAGAAACERLCARGWRVTLIERHAAPAREASGNLAGIFMPQLSRDDNPATRLSRAGFLFALRQWRALGGIGAAFAGARCGVLQLARDAAHGRLQRQIAASGAYPPDYVRWLEPDAAGALLGAPAPDGGWLFEQGGWARPSSLCAALLDACGGLLERRFSNAALELARIDGQWQVRGADGLLLAEAPTLILANGTGARALAQAAGLPLTAVRGQVTHLAPDSVPPLPLVVCREAYITLPSDGVVCVGATYDDDDDATLRAASQCENLDKLAAILGHSMRQAARTAPLAGRTGFRCVAPDRLPLVGALPDPAAPGRGGPIERLRDVPRWPGLYGLLGYASHGMTWAPLAAELLAAQLDGEPLPVEASLATALDPARFLLKELRRSGGRR